MQNVSASSRVVQGRAGFYFGQDDWNPLLPCLIYFAVVSPNHRHQAPAWARSELRHVLLTKVRGTLRGTLHGDVHASGRATGAARACRPPPAAHSRA
jgi:hypothetical protein